MTALITFIRELGNELNRTADAIDEEAKPLGDSTNEADKIVAILADSQARTLRHIANAVSRAAKKALHL